MLRTAIKPRWLSLLAVVLAVIGAFTLLGLWQLDVAKSSTDRDAAQAAQDRGVVPLVDVARPHTPLGADAVGRFVVARGRYDTEKQVLVTPRRLGDTVGRWVVTPLIVSENGALLPVVRAFVPDTASVPDAPSGTLTVTGMLAPGESPPDRPVSLPEGQLATVDLARLVNRWREDLYSGFLFATAEESAAPSSAVTAVQRVPPPQPGSTGVAWRNLAYALQWWLFAGFALYMWWRMVREDHNRSQDGKAHTGPPPLLPRDTEPVTPPVTSGASSTRADRSVAKGC